MNPGMILTIDREFLVLHGLGPGADELIGWPLVSMVHWRVRGRVCRGLQRMFTERRVACVEQVRIWVGSELWPCTLRAAPVSAGQNEAPRQAIVSVRRDTTAADAESGSPSHDHVLEALVPLLRALDTETLHTIRARIEEHVLFMLRAHVVYGAPRVPKGVSKTSRGRSGAKLNRPPGARHQAMTNLGP